MAIFTDITEQVATLRDLFGDDVEPAELATRMSSLDDDALVAAMTATAILTRRIERVSIVAAGIAARRSTRDAGHAGLAQSRGHRNPASLIQDLGGLGRAEAQKQVRLGTALLEHDGGREEPGAASADGGAEGEGDDEATDARRRTLACWHAPVGEALLSGLLSSAQHDAILRGLGAPPGDGDDAREAWQTAAEQLVQEAQVRTAEELRIAARAIRDQLDPEGAERRFAERFERRSFRMYIDEDGVHHARLSFDDDGAAWIRSIIDAALRPRRGGPRFVDSAERERAADLTMDTRTNDQLAYDLVLDVLRAGALADAETVFGTRQPGVRLVRVVDPTTGTSGAVQTEDGGFALPRAVADQHVCDSGVVPVTVDTCGNPLDVGREHRLFTPKQRIALAVRDGGCLWRGCDRPASYCEAHHIDEWDADGGRTDIDRGILLCRYHHMQLHHGGWRITRAGRDDFLLHPPGSAPPLSLPPRLARRYAWGDIDPPPQRFRPVA